MKKVISILLVLVMLCTLTACRKDAEENSAPDASPVSTPTPSPSAAPSETPASGSDIPVNTPELPASFTDLPDIEYPASDSDIAE